MAVTFNANDATHQQAAKDFYGNLQSMVSNGDEAGAKAAYSKAQQDYGFTNDQFAQYGSGGTFTGQQINDWSTNPKVTAASAPAAASTGIVNTAVQAPASQASSQTAALNAAEHPTVNAAAQPAAVTASAPQTTYNAQQQAVIDTANQWAAKNGTTAQQELWNYATKPTDGRAAMTPDQIDQYMGWGKGTSDTWAKANVSGYQSNNGSNIVRQVGFNDINKNTWGDYVKQFPNGDAAIRNFVQTAQTAGLNREQLLAKMQEINPGITSDVANQWFAKNGMANSPYYTGQRTASGAAATPANAGGVDPGTNAAGVSAGANTGTNAVGVINRAIGPVTTTNWNVTPDMLVKNQLADLLAPNSALMQQAQTKGAQFAASRGLLNSSMGETAVLDAMLAAATPIATSDAATYAKSGEFNANAANTVNIANQTNDTSRYGIDTSAATSKYGVDTTAATSKYGTDTQKTIADNNNATSTAIAAANNTTSTAISAANNTTSREIAAANNTAQASLGLSNNQYDMLRTSSNAVANLMQNLTNQIVSINKDTSFSTPEAMQAAIENATSTTKAGIRMIEATAGTPEIAAYIDVLFPPTEGEQRDASGGGKETFTAGKWVKTA